MILKRHRCEEYSTSVNVKRYLKLGAREKECHLNEKNPSYRIRGDRERTFLHAQIRQICPA